MSLAVMEEEDVFAQPCWPGEGWWDEVQLVWDAFCQHGDFTGLDNEAKPLKNYRVKMGSIGAKSVLQPNQSKTFTFAITWSFPNRTKGWYEAEAKKVYGEDGYLTKNFYATKHQNSWETQNYISKNMKELYDNTIKFHDALFSSSLESYVLDAVSSNITVARSTTCFRLENGKFFGWEGCHDTEGSCDGNCTHVWNYQQTLAFLFPSLERDMRVTEFNIETEVDGKMQFRTKKLFGSSNNYHAAADGQLGCIIRLYRDWKLSGDDQFLKDVWENAKKALGYAFTFWDSDNDFVLDSQQHNTYDIEFYGPNSLVNSMFFGAL